MRKEKTKYRWYVRMICGVLVFAMILVGLSFGGKSNPTINRLLTKMHIINQRCGTGLGGFSFINVGNGDACCVYNNQVVGLIDTGTREKSGEIIQYLHSLKTDTLDFVVLSHLHTDHAGGYLNILKEFTIKTLYVLPYDDNDFEHLALYQQIIQQSKQQGTDIVTVSHQRVENYDGISLTFYDFTWCATEENQKSLVVSVTIGEKRCLFMGDAGEHIESQIMYLPNIGQTDILKVAHHGSKDATSQLFLSAVSPTYSVVSVGVNNYGHPSPETLERLNKQKCKIFRTDICRYVLLAIDETNEVIVQVQ